MSHFSVLVIGEDPKTLLARYDENLDVAPYRDYDNAKTPEEFPLLAETLDALQVWRQIAPTVGDAPSDEDLLAALAAIGQPRSQLAGVRWVRTHEDLVTGPVTWETAANVYNAFYETEAGDSANEVMHFDEKGLYLWSTYNPKSKWDWYVLGGRWNGFFICQHGGKENQLRKHEINWAAMRAEGNVKGHSKMDQVFRVIAGLPTPTRWATIRDSGVSMDAARNLYNTQPAVEALNKAGLSPGFDCLVETYCLDSPDPRAAYVARRESFAVTPFAICTQEWWRSRGDMGWFGVVTNSADDWPERAARIIEAAPDDALFSLFDAHI